MFLRLGIVFFAIGIYCTIANPGSSEEEEKECVNPLQDAFIFPRTFFFAYRGTPSYESSREMMEKTLGDCGDVDDFAMEALEYLESYGVNMTEVKKDPFATHMSPDFRVNTVVNGEADYAKVVYETFYEYARVLNTGFHWLSWAVWVREQHEGPAGVVPADHVLSLGIYRFRTNGREFCVRGQHAPRPSSGNVGPVNLELFNDYWGRGAGRGLYVNEDDAGKLDVRLSMTFPAHP